mmetsp:Transcript_35438/g.76466  ORF Transcript_35438/g.76466 Transcript_35438/m.76466 type:complete len:967 (-) Transcript_35438:175-3075(-)
MALVSSSPPFRGRLGYGLLTTEAEEIDNSPFFVSTDSVVGANDVVQTSNTACRPLKSGLERSGSSMNRHHHNHHPQHLSESPLTAVRGSDQQRQMALPVGAKMAAAKVEGVSASLKRAETDSLDMLQVGDTCESLTMVTLRAGECIFSEVITELPAALEMKILQLGEGGPRRRALVLAGNLKGWITVQTSFYEPLVRIRRGLEVPCFDDPLIGRRIRLHCLTQLREGEASDSKLIRELAPNFVVRLKKLAGRRGKVAVDFDGGGEGWITMVSPAGQPRVSFVPDDEEDQSSIPAAPPTSPSTTQSPQKNRRRRKGKTTKDSLAAAAGGSGGGDGESGSHNRNHNDEEDEDEDDEEEMLDDSNSVWDAAEVGRRQAEESLRAFLADPAAGHPNSLPSSSRALQAAIREATVMGADADLLASAKKLLRKLEAREQLTALLAVCGGGAANAPTLERGQIRALEEALEEARSNGVEEKDLLDVVDVLSSGKQRRQSLQVLQEAKEKCKSADRSSLASVGEAKAHLVAAISDARARGCLEQELQSSDALRKQLHNVQEDLKGAIRIFCRVRPLSPKEVEAGETSIVSAVDTTTIAVETGRGTEHFGFDAVFLPGTQEEIFEDLKHLLQSALDGYNVTIFAYGQTGAGKTHTMYGSEEDQGTAPRAISELFQLLERDREVSDFAVHASMTELYRNELVDLLHGAASSSSSSSTAKRASTSSRKEGGNRGSLDLTSSSSPDLRRLSVQVDPSGEVVIPGLTEVPCKNAEELSSILERGSASRKIAATALNAQSSRSHLILTIRIVRSHRSSGRQVQGKIMMCDLAGSERLKKSHVSGERQKESIEINKSLTAMGDVIEALTNGHMHVPYKNHKLTQVLQDSLGGSAKTLMFLNCSPATSSMEETSNTLRYAQRVKKVVDRRSSNIAATATATAHAAPKRVSTIATGSESGAGAAAAAAASSSSSSKVKVPPAS